MKVKLIRKFRNNKLFKMHAWLALALPDVPERPAVKEDEAEASMIYQSTFIGTLLKCKYK